MNTVKIYTDGSCLKNPGGPGGWAAILSQGVHNKLISGCEPYTTNNRMELTAVIKGISRLKNPCIVEVYSDSKYVTNPFNLGWMNNWKVNGEVPNDRKNYDLWNQLLLHMKEHQVSFIWVKGHAGHKQNEWCDVAANTAARSQIGAEQWM